MIAFKTGLWIGVVVILALIVWLGWQNRASEKVQVNFPTALLVGFGTVLVTLIFTLTPESVKEEFPTDFIVDPISKQPFSCEFFPDISSYADPGAGISFRSWRDTIIPILRQKIHT
jgi:multisubunit Na+/H+ antiporter MnhB subunit